MSRQRPVPPPPNLADEGRGLWLRAQRHLRAQGTWQDADAPLLESYVRAVETSRTCRVVASGQPFVEGSQGQPVAHPGLKVAAEADRDACRYAAALLLTPEARKRHELEPRPVAAEPFLGIVA